MANKYLDNDGLLYLWSLIKAHVTNSVANKVDKVKGSTLIPETKLALIDTNASDIDALEVRVAANEAKLVGITTTVVSTINTAIDAAMTWYEVTE